MAYNMETQIHQLAQDVSYCCIYLICSSQPLHHKKKQFVKEKKDKSLTLEMVSNEQPCVIHNKKWPCNGEYIYFFPQYGEHVLTLQLEKG